MGVSTNAYLFYGYHLPEDFEPPEEATELWEGDVLMGSHCSMDCPMWYVYIKGSETRAWRGEPQPVNVRDMAYKAYPSDDWDNKIRSFAVKYGLPVPGENIDLDGGQASDLGWWLASYWG